MPDARCTPRAEARPAIPSRAKRCRVHRISSRVRDDRDTPLWWGGMRKVLDLIWGKCEQKYLSENQKKDSTAPSTNRPTGKSQHGRMERSEIRDRRRVIPGFRGACHRARIRATRWLHPGYDVRQRHCLV